jgi:hypothetical protein
MFIYCRSVYDTYKQRSALFARIICNLAARQRRERETGNDDKDEGEDEGREEDEKDGRKKMTRAVDGGRKERDEEPTVRTCHRGSENSYGIPAVGACRCQSLL